MKLSIIIPTLNEEKSLPALLNCIKSDAYADYEIIVADAGSSDNTIKIAKFYGAKIVKGGLPAAGRNNGAKVAKGEFLLFLDADIVFPPNFLSITVKEQEERSLDVGSYRIYPQKSNLILNKATLNVFYNYWMRPMTYGAAAILCRKEIFDSVGGYDESISLAEDHYFMSRVAKRGKYGVFRGTKCFISVRRFEQDGYMRTLFKYVLCGIKLKTVGPDRNGEFKYDFGHYEKEKVKE